MYKVRDRVVIQDTTVLQSTKKHQLEESCK